MLLSYMILSCALFGPSGSIKFEQGCYGESYTFPTQYSQKVFSGNLRFNSNDWGPMKVLIDYGEIKDPRIRFSNGKPMLTDLRDSDTGMFTLFDRGFSEYEVIKLRVVDCAKLITKYYGGQHIFNVPSQAEYLEFSRLRSGEQTMVLWNRTDPDASKGSRGNMRTAGWEIVELTQEDNGYYTFRKKDNTLQSMIKLRVQENIKYYDAEVSGQLLIQNSFRGASWTVTFTPEGGWKNQTLIKAGTVVTSTPFRGRIRIVSDGIKIDPVEITDSGTFELRDVRGNLAHLVTVTVVKKSNVNSVLFYVGILFGTVLPSICCCCCAMRLFSKKKTSKRRETTPAAVNHYNEPSTSAAPASAYSYQPLNPPSSRERTAGPSVYNPTHIQMNPIQSEVGAPGGRGAPPFSSNNFSLDSDPRFEPKGLNCPSFLPLSSESTVSDVYTSDKLNFL